MHLTSAGQETPRSQVCFCTANNFTTFKVSCIMPWLELVMQFYLCMCVCLCDFANPSNCVTNKIGGYIDDKWLLSLKAFSLE